MAIKALSLFLVILPQVANCDAFLEAHPSRATPGAVPHSMQRRAILMELEEAFGSSDSNDHRLPRADRLSYFESALQPTFDALPKNVQGVLGTPTARYALRRLFLQQHGWQVKGLEPAGEAWVGAQPAVDLGGRVPASIQKVFNQRFNNGGLDLHELAVFAAILEHLIHSEAVVRLRATYNALLLPVEGATVNGTEARMVVDAYMASYILGANTSSMTPEIVAKQHKQIRKLYPSWNETQAFMREVEQAVVPNTTKFSFATVTTVVEEIGKRYGRWQAEECRMLKNELIGLEEMTGTGRVRLADFYGSALHGGKWQFREGVRYLRQLGALDDSDPDVLRVIIPNYINAPSNCIASLGYYAVCCIDECEDILGHLERELEAPSATPAKIAALVAALPSATVLGNRMLPPTLLQRLNDISAHHGGQVPLHSRLFAQWLHHAYPRECPYPHVSGTTRPMLADEWEADGHKVSATKEEMQQHYEAGITTRRSYNESEPGIHIMMWTMEEELVDPHAHAYHQTAATPGFAVNLHGFALFMAVWSVVFALAKIFWPAMAPMHMTDYKDNLAQKFVYSL